MIKRFSHDQMLHQIGGRYLILLIAVAQIIALAGAIPGILSIQANAEFKEQQLRTFSIWVPLLIIITNLLLLEISRRITPAARKKLDVWADDSIRVKPEDDFLAWREITSLSWRYGIAAIFVIFIIDILPVFVISSTNGQRISSVFQSATLNAPDAIYALIGGAVSLFGSVIFVILMIERFTLPLRLILLPKDFETQLKGHSGLLLNGRFLILTLSLIATTILLIAPIGYVHTMRVLTYIRCEC